MKKDIASFIIVLQTIFFMAAQGQERILTQGIRRYFMEKM